MLYSDVVLWYDIKQVIPKAQRERSIKPGQSQFARFLFPDSTKPGQAQDSGQKENDVGEQEQPLQ